MTGRTQFLEWCKLNGELSDFDVEMIENDLFLFPSVNFEKYIHFNKGSLYEFFDSLKIYCTIELATWKTKTLFFYEIVRYKKKAHNYIVEQIYHKTRKETELAMFKKAFEILEERI